MWLIQGWTLAADPANEIFRVLVPQLQIASVVMYKARNETFSNNNIKYREMKRFKFIFSLITFSCLLNVISAQVNVQGNISFSTTWTKTLSPYNVVGDVQVPAAVTLTIEPGVELSLIHI